MAGKDLSNSHNTANSKGQYNFGPPRRSLVFPQDLDGKGYYPDVIKFGIYHKQGASYDAIKTKTIEAAVAIKNDFDATSLASEIASLDDQISDIGFQSFDNVEERELRIKLEQEKATKEATIKQISNPRKVSKDGNEETAIVTQGKKVLKELQKQAGNLTPDKQVITHRQSIFLNMPASLALDESITWEGVDLGAAGAMKNSSKLGEGAANAMESGLLSNMGTLLGGAATAVAGPAAAVLGAITAGDTLQAGFESSFRVKANPFKEQTFQGVPFRSFSFEFSLRARNEEEIEMIQSIVQSFRAFSKPSFQSDTAVAFNYPHEFRIEFLTKDDSNDSYITNEYLPQIKYCVCTKVGSNFGGDTWRTFRRGAPTEIQLSLEFQETELITQEDVEGQTNVGFFKGYKGKF
jgi:hypothetical protein